MKRQALGLAGLVAAIVLMPAADAATSPLLVRPNPVAFGGVAPGSSASRVVRIRNRGRSDARPRVSVGNGAPQFAISEGDTFTCPTLRRNATCAFHVVYRPSS